MCFETNRTVLRSMSSKTFFCTLWYGNFPFDLFATVWIYFWVYKSMEINKNRFPVKVTSESMYFSASEKNLCTSLHLLFKILVLHGAKVWQLYVTNALWV